MTLKSQTRRSAASFRGRLLLTASVFGLATFGPALAASALQDAEVAARAADAHVHLVRPGETLNQIAKRYGLKPEALALNNRLADMNRIQAGARLWLGEKISDIAQDIVAPEPATVPRPGNRPQVRPMEAPPEVLAELEAAKRQRERGLLAQDGQVLSAALPVLANNQRLAPVAAVVTPVELLQVSPGGLGQSLGALIDDVTIAELTALGFDPIPVEQVAALGLGLRLDPGTISVAVEIPPTRRRGTRFSRANTNDYPGAIEVDPARFAFGATGALLVSDQLGDGVDPNGQFAVSGFLNFGGLRGLNLDYSGAYQFSSDRGDFQRGPILAFVDRPEQALRYSAGDIVPQTSGLAGVAPILGLSVERSYQLLQPNRIVRPTGRRSFLLERASTIEVYSNGVLVNRFATDAGPVDLADLPFSDVSNQISIVVEDALGRRELDSFSLANDLSLLAAGVDEFSFAAGVLRDPVGIGFNYTDNWALSAFYARGLNDQLTVSGGMGLTEAVQVGSASVAFGGFGGVALFDAAVSQSNSVGDGHALGAAYRAGGLFGDGSDTLTVRADYTSVAFASLDDPFSLNDLEWVAGVDYQIAVMDRTFLSVGAIYTSRHAFDGADRFATVGLSRSFGPVQASVTGRIGENFRGESEQALFFSLSRSLGGRVRASASYDTDQQRSRVEVVRSRRIETPDYSYRLTAEDDPRGQALTGQVGYFGSRFEADLQVNSVLGGPTSGGERVTGRLQSGFAYADGTLAVGRDPGRGFLMVRAHPSLGRARTELQQGRLGGQALARGGAGWPAVSVVPSAYRPTELSVAVYDAPPGYDVGDTRFSVTPGARTGIVLDVGDDSFRTRMAVIAFEGEPIALRYGRLRSERTGEVTTFFTNRTGRAAFNKLNPGAYTITFPGVPGRYTFVIAAEEPALLDLGQILLERTP